MERQELSVVNSEIAEQARQIATEDADDLAVLQFLMQSSATAQLVKLRKLEESKIPVGVYSLPLTVPDSPVTELSLSPPWISFSLIQGGPGALYLDVNKPRGPITSRAPILVGQPYSVDFGFPAINKLYLQAAPGTQAAIVIHAKLGSFPSISQEGQLPPGPPSRPPTQGP